MEKVEIVNSNTMQDIEGFSFKINHYRNYDKKHILKNGGYTVLSFVKNGIPFSVTARCSASETYDKKKGIYQCFLKYCKRHLKGELTHVDKDMVGTYVVYVDQTVPSQVSYKGEF
jgi:hypothetical protein